MASTGLAHQAYFSHKAHTRTLAQSHVCTHAGERTGIHLAPTPKWVLRVGAEAMPSPRAWEAMDVTQMGELERPT